MRVPWQILEEFAIVTWFLVRALGGGGVATGTFRALDWPAAGDSPADRGRRAVIAVAATYSPNSYVVHVDEEEDVVLVHDLVPRRKQEMLVWTPS